VLFALVILNEHLNRWEIVGAIAIAGGIVLERRRSRPIAVPAE
jgi:drug/metabolite transporter (DMT)-like permease